MKTNLSIILYFLLWMLISSSHAASLGDQLQQALGGEQSVSDEILPPEEAFYFTYELKNPNLVFISWDIEYGYYLYQNRFKIESLTPGLELGEINWPGGEQKDDPAFGLVTVNKDKVEIDLPLNWQNGAQPLIKLGVHYQGCKEGSVCYPPQEQILEIALSDTEALASSAKNSADQKIAEQDAILQRLAGGNAMTNIGLFFIFGLLLSLTPCVFPMVPILSGIIVGQGQTITPLKAFYLSCIYVLAMALTYALLGILAASFGINLQAASQNIWVMLSFSGIFILLALSMFGFYELQLPAAWQSALNRWSEQQAGGSSLGTAIMGVFSAIIVGPCVAPPLAGALLYISQTGDALLGGLALFAMGLGFGVPLLVIGTSAGRLLPKAGAWMQTVKNIFGVIMLGVAIWFLQRVLPGMVTMLLWAALLIVSAIYMGALDAVEQGWPRLWKGLAVVLLTYGLMLVAAAAMGGSDPLRPFHGVAVFSSTNSSVKSQSLAFKRIKTATELSQELEQAASNQQNVMLDFYADWCVACKEMEHKTFSEKDVQNSLAGVVLLQADVTANDELDQQLLKQFNLFGPPAILFFNQQGQERKNYRLVGYVEAQSFIHHVGQAIQ